MRFGSEPGMNALAPSFSQSSSICRLGDPRRCLPHFQCRCEDGIYIDRRPSGVIGQGHRCSTDHEHFPPDPNGTQLLVEGSQCYE
jgi:hypothetical protein